MKGQESNDLRASRKDQGRDEEQNVLLSQRDILDLRLALRRVSEMLDQLLPLEQALALSQVWQAIHNAICDECPNGTLPDEEVE